MSLIYFYQGTLDLGDAAGLDGGHSIALDQRLGLAFHRGLKPAHRRIGQGAGVQIVGGADAGSAGRAEAQVTPGLDLGVGSGLNGKPQFACR